MLGLESGPHLENVHERGALQISSGFLHFTNGGLDLRRPGGIFGDRFGQLAIRGAQALFYLLAPLRECLLFGLQDLLFIGVQGDSAMQHLMEVRLGSRRIVPNHDNRPGHQDAEQSPSNRRQRKTS